MPARTSATPAAGNIERSGPVNGCAVAAPEPEPPPDAPPDGAAFATAPDDGTVVVAVDSAAGAVVAVDPPDDGAVVGVVSEAGVVGSAVVASTITVPTMPDDSCTVQT